MSDLDGDLRKAVEILRETGLAEDAEALNRLLGSAWTSSSEMLGEIGLAIVRTMRAHGSELPPGVVAAFEAMLAEIEKTWPAIRKQPIPETKPATR